MLVPVGWVKDGDISQEVAKIKIKQKKASEDAASKPCPTQSQMDAKLD